MWLIADYLKIYKIENYITEGPDCILSARMVSENSAPVENTIYVSTELTEHPCVLCTCRKDIIRVYTEDAEEVLNRILDCIEYYNRWEAKLRLNLKKYTLNQLLEDSLTVLPGNITLGDRTYYAAAMVIGDPDMPFPEVDLIKRDGMRSLASIRLFQNALAQYKVYTEPYYLSVPELSISVLVRNIFTGNTFRGWLAYDSGIHPISRKYIPLLNELGSIIEQWYEDHYPEQSPDIAGELFTSIADRSFRDRDIILRRLAFLGFQEEGRYQCVYVEPASDSLPEETFQRKIRGMNAGICMFSYHEKLYGIINEKLFKDRKDHIQKQFARILELSRYQAGISPFFEDIFELGEYMDMAGTALQYAPCRKTVNPFEPSVLRFIFGQMREILPEFCFHPAIRLLQEYDIQHQTRLVETLRVFLEEERNLVSAAGRLNIHRNTLLYRIRRISELTGTDLDQADTRFHLMLTLRALQDKAAGEI